MGNADDLRATLELDRLIGAVGAGNREPSDTAARMQVLVEALKFYATVENYQEVQVMEGGRLYFVCPIEEDEQGMIARRALTEVVSDY